MVVTPVRARGKRPLGVAVIAVFLVLDSILAVLQLAGDTPLTTRLQTLLDVSDLAPGGMLVLAGVRVLAAVGLWSGSRRAWVLTMVIVGIGLVVSFYLYVQHDPPYLRLAIDVVIAFYLNQGAVRDYFTGRTGQPAPVVRPGDPSRLRNTRLGGTDGD